MAYSDLSKDQDGLVPAAIESWFRHFPTPVNPLQLPAPGGPVLSLVIDATDAPAAYVASTVASYRRGTVQEIPLQICGLGGSEAGMLRSWLSREARVSFPLTPAEVDCTADSLLAVPAGILFSPYSLEAAHEALDAAEGCVVVRAVVDGAPRAVELWRSMALGPGRHRAEEKARRNGSERWVSGASLGLHYHGHPQPKPHLRKGLAGTLDLRIVVEDGAVPRVQQGYLDRIKSLEGEVAQLQRAQWSNALRIRSGGDAATAARGGARRMLRRLARAMGAGRR